jgi:hypothetical protein
MTDNTEVNSNALATYNCQNTEQMKPNLKTKLILN